MNDLKNTENRQPTTDNCVLTQEASGICSQSSVLPAVLLQKIEEAITHYPVSKRSAALPLLHLWQNHFGFIDESGVEWIAAKLELNPIAILEIVTFYPWFRQNAPGKTIIRVCRTLSCAMAGAYELHDAFCKATGIDPEHPHEQGMPTSPDGKFSVEFVECLASCGSAPVCLVNKDLLECVAPAEVAAIVEERR
ncbi:MAG: NAD(P)H-dependent oxidoreductase subunit E [Chthoniobacterales bacterium]|nr:NAD(P)H-dependent oxidoreductase subunit E [Chthoniobacterales bacterium]